MGISPNAPRHSIETLPALPADLQWARLNQVPVLQNEVDVRHAGAKETTMTNRKGPAFYWKASFPMAVASQPANTQTPEILVDGARVRATVESRPNLTVISITVPVQPGQTRTAKLHN
jgi:hypothetical protein